MTCCQDSLFHKPSLPFHTHMNSLECRDGKTLHWLIRVCCVIISNYKKAKSYCPKPCAFWQTVTKDKPSPRRITLMQFSKYSLQSDRKRLTFFSKRPIKFEHPNSERSEERHCQTKLMGILRSVGRKGLHKQVFSTLAGGWERPFIPQVHLVNSCMYQEERVAPKTRIPKRASKDVLKVGFMEWKKFPAHGPSTCFIESLQIPRISVFLKEHNSEMCWSFWILFAHMYKPTCMYVF